MATGVSLGDGVRNLVTIGEAIDNLEQARLAPAKRQDWGTPQSFYNKLYEEFGFTWDLAAHHGNKRTERFYGPGSPWGEDSLAMEWGQLGPKVTAYLNPPYARGIGEWVHKAYSSQLKLNAPTIVMLLPSSTDTEWWHECVMQASEIRFVRGRLRFTLDDGARDSARFSNAVVIFDQEMWERPYPNVRDQERE